MRAIIAKKLRKMAEQDSQQSLSESTHQEFVRGDWISASFGRLITKLVPRDEDNAKKGFTTEHELYSKNANASGEVRCSGARSLYKEYKRRYKRGELIFT